MNARPTILSIILGIISLALSGPMILLATVDDENCPLAGSDAPRACWQQLGDGDFWQRVAASGIGSIAEPWQQLTALLLPMFGIPLFLSSIRRAGSGPLVEEPVKVPPAAKPGG